MKIITACFIVAFTAGAIAGCGGGSYSGSSPMPMQNLQSATAPSQPMNVTSTTLSTTYGGNNYSVTVSNTPGGMMMFNGQKGDHRVLNVTLTKKQQGGRTAQ